MSRRVLVAMSGGVDSSVAAEIIARVWRRVADAEPVPAAEAAR